MEECGREEAGAHPLGLDFGPLHGEAGLDHRLLEGQLQLRLLLAQWQIATLGLLLGCLLVRRLGGSENGSECGGCEAGLSHGRRRRQMWSSGVVHSSDDGGREGRFWQGRAATVSRRLGRGRERLERADRLKLELAVALRHHLVERVGVVDGQDLLQRLLTRSRVHHPLNHRRKLLYAHAGGAEDVRA